METCQKNSLRKATSRFFRAFSLQTALLVKLFFALIFSTQKVYSLSGLSKKQTFSVILDVRSFYPSISTCLVQHCKKTTLFYLFAGAFLACLQVHILFSRLFFLHLFSFLQNKDLFSLTSQKFVNINRINILF